MVKQNLYTTVQKFGVSKNLSFFFFFKEMNAFMLQRCIIVIKRDSKHIYNVPKCYSFELYINQILISAKILSNTALIIV